MSAEETGGVGGDLARRLFPRAWHLGVLTGLFALGLNLWGMSWHASSPIGVAYLVEHLGLDGSVPLKDLPWGMLVKFSWRFPPPTMDIVTALASGLLGALSVGLLTGLMVRVGYPHPGYEAATTPMREAVARRISALTAGLYLALSAPHWWASTRAMPATSWLVAGLGVAWLFSWWQNSGKKSALALWAFGWGAAMAGNGGFWVTLPLGVILFGRELMRWGTVKDWRQYALFLGGWGLGLGTIVFWAAWAWRFGGWTLYGSRWELLAAMAKAQVTTWLPWVRAVPMLLLYGCVTLVPWWLLFVGSCRAPWFYERGQVMLRVLLGGLLLAGLYNWMVAPWKLAGGMLDPALAPTALNAACMGYLAGEFWILGERKPLADAGKRKFIRGVATVLGALTPVAVLGAIGMNAAWVMGDRKGDGVWSAACGILDSRGDRDILFAGPPFDDALLLAVKERGENVQVVRMAGRAKKPYLDRQAAAFPMAEVREACAEGAWERIFPLWSTYPGGLERTIVVPGTEGVRAWAHPMPVGYAWHLEPRDGGTPPETVLARQRPVWQHQADWLKRRLDEQSPAYFYRAMMCTVAARNLNDLGVEFAEAGDVRTAARLWGLAMKFQEKHLAAAMNRVMAKRMLNGKMPEGTDEDDLPGDLRDTREVINWLGKCEEWLLTHASTPKRQRATHWSIALQYGLVWKAETWMRAGYPWAGSGMAPEKGNPHLKHESHVLVGLAGNNSLTRWIDSVCLRVGTQEVKPEYVYATLCARPGDTELLGMLAWHYLRRGEWEFAASHIREAERATMGTGTFPMRFEQVLTDAMRAGILPHSPEGSRSGQDGFLWPELWFPEGTGEKTRAQREPFTLEEAMLATAQAIPTDPRPWMALWMEGVGGADRWYAERILTEQGLSNGHIGLSMAFGALLNEDVATAKKELFKSMSRTEKNPMFWRLLHDIATAEGNKKLADGAEKRLRLMIPELNKGR